MFLVWHLRWWQTSAKTSIFELSQAMIKLHPPGFSVGRRLSVGPRNSPGGRSQGISDSPFQWLWLKNLKSSPTFCHGYSIFSCQFESRFFFHFFFLYIDFSRPKAGSCWKKTWANSCRLGTCHMGKFSWAKNKSELFSWGNVFSTYFKPLKMILRYS